MWVGPVDDAAREDPVEMRDGAGHPLRSGPCPVLLLARYGIVVRGDEGLARVVVTYVITPSAG